MKIMRAGSIGLSLILVLTNLSLPQVVRASDEPLADILYANAVAAPIGTIESSGTMLINGRAAEGSGAVWDGELLQAPAGTNAHAVLRGIGEVTLKSGAVVRLSTAMVSADRQTACAPSGKPSNSLRAALTQEIGRVVFVNSISGCGCCHI